MEAPAQRVPSQFMISLTQFLVGLLLFIALLKGERDLIVLTLIVLGLAIGTRLWAARSLSGIKYQSNIDRERLFPGERLRLEIRAENRRFLPAWLQMEIPPSGLVSPASGPANLVRESSLLWKQSVCLRWDLVAHQRGVYRIGPPLLRASDLFGFFSKEKKVEGIHEIVVYPRLVPLKPFPLPRRDFFGIPGARSPVKDPIYILGTRDYQHGQPAKHIHWKASARYQRLQEKVFETSEQEKVLIAVDVDPFAKRGMKDDFEHALEIAASLTVRLERRGYAVGLMTNGALLGEGSPLLPIARGPKQLPAILEALARLQMESQRGGMETLLRTSSLPWGASCVYFTYEEDGTTLAVEEHFRHQKTPVLFLLSQPQSPAGESPAKVRGKIYRIRDICLEEGLRT
jgi:uncharacterized protein (DUF58 family)